MAVVSQLLKNLTLKNTNNLIRTAQFSTTSVCYRLKKRVFFVEKPKPGKGDQFRRIVHFPENYTVEPLKTTHLAGRDPKTGRVVAKGIGGGVKHKYHWIQWMRDGPEEGPPKEEKVVEILKCGCRSADVALVACGDELKYYLATVNMKPGDIIRTSKALTKVPVFCQEGDAYPLGSLPIGTKVHNVQLTENSDYTIIHSAGNSGIIKRHLGGKVVVQIPGRKRELAISPKCMATVGRLSNIDHDDIPIGSPQRLREMGYRPRSGLWQRKDGRFGRKIRPPPPLKEMLELQPEREYIRHTLPGNNYRI